MHWTLVVPLALGIVAVLQATLNRSIAASTGLAAAATLNMIVATVCALGFAAYCMTREDATGALRWQPDLGAFRWWWLLPGLVGFAIVLGLPWAVARIGALQTFVVLVGAQMVTSAVWDRFVEGIPFSTPRVAGAGFTVLGVWLVSRSGAA